MRKVTITALLTLMIMLVSFRSAAQDSTVMIVANKSVLFFTVDVINPQNEMTSDTYKLRNHSMYVVLKEELDRWMQSGYAIVNSSTAGESDIDYEIIYILAKEE